jgi:hypothetical protein
LLCKSFECYGIPPSGDTIKFIKIDDWDFHWQGGHNFQKPIKIPVGTVLYSKAFYDNTTKQFVQSTSKTFVIDHPVDPERYLVHACLEGPEAGIYYRGKSFVNDSVISGTSKYIINNC